MDMNKNKSEKPCKTRPIILHALPYPTRSAASGSACFLKGQGARHRDWRLAPVIRDKLGGRSGRLRMLGTSKRENTDKSESHEISERRARSLPRPKKENK